MEGSWYLYILRCGDGTLYTGITNDVTKRFQAHCCGKGAKYTRGRGPLELVYRENCGAHPNALRREREVKKMTRLQKLQMLCSADAVAVSGAEKEKFCQRDT